MRSHPLWIPSNSKGRPEPYSAPPATHTRGTIAEARSDSAALVLGDPEAPALIAECIGGIISQEQSAGHRKKRRANHVGVAHEA